MARIDDLMDDVLPAAPGAPEFVVRQDIKDAARTFCDRSGVWQETLDPITPQEGQSLYGFDRFATDVKSVVWGYYGDRPLNEEMDRDIVLNNQGNPEGGPVVFSVTVDSQFRVHPIPGAGDTDDLLFRVVLKPNRNVTELPDWLVNDWRDALVMGAQVRLLAQPNQPWADFEQANYLRRFYRDEEREAKVRGMAGPNSSVTLDQPAFGGVSGRPHWK